jgi:hypothetical protein
VVELVKLAGSIAMAIGFAMTARSQPYPTNFVNFSDLSTLAAQPDNRFYQGLYTNLDPGIGMTFGWQIWAENDLAAPSGSLISINSAPGSAITFSSPVILWSVMAAGNAKIEGLKNGVVVWTYTGPGDWGWATATNGAGIAIDELVFPNAWDSRYTDFYIQDAAAIGVPPVSTFGVTPDAAFRGLGVPVKLLWSVAPGATVTIDNDIGDVSAWTDPGTGAGSYMISPTNTTTYTLTSTIGTNMGSAQVTVKGSTLPPEVGFLTFENITGAATVDPYYSWNAPQGVYLLWQNWGVSAGAGSGTPFTDNEVWPEKGAQLSSTNSTGATNNASIQFQDVSSAPLPVMVNSFAVLIDTNLAQPDPVGWGPVHVEGLLGGVVQWTFDESEAVQWENIVTKGAGIPVDEMRFSGFYYQYDNFAISTAPLPTPVLASPAAQNGQFQFSWKSVADWASYAVMGKTALTDKWQVQSQGGISSTPTGTTNTVTQAAANNSGFFRVLRVP